MQASVREYPSASAAGPTVPAQACSVLAPPPLPLAGPRLQGTLAVHVIDVASATLVFSHTGEPMERLVSNLALAQSASPPPLSQLKARPAANQTKQKRLGLCSGPL